MTSWAGGERARDEREPRSGVLAALSRAIFEADEASLSPPRRAVVFLVRLLWLVTRAFFRDQLQIRAASLAFTTLLAFVPAAAVAFFFADTFGATAILVDESITPFLDDTFGRADDASLPEGVRALRSMADALITMVRSTDVRGLGLIGISVLVGTLYRVLSGTEEAFAHIFTYTAAGISYTDPMQGPLEVYVDEYALSRTRLPCP